MLINYECKWYVTGWITSSQMGSKPQKNGNDGGEKTLGNGSG